MSDYIEAPDGALVVGGVTYIPNTLHNAMQSALSTLRGINLNLSNQVEALGEYLKDNRDELELHAEEIAGIFGIKLEREYEVTLTVEYTFTVETSDKVNNEWVEMAFESATLDNTAPDTYDIESYEIRKR